MMDDREIEDLLKDVGDVMRQLTAPILARLDALEAQANVVTAESAWDALRTIDGEAEKRK